MELLVQGIPHSEKSRPPTAGFAAWRETLAAALKDTETVAFACHVRLDFLLPAEVFQPENAQNPHGPDLDNLVAPVLDALARSVLVPAGGDGAVWELVATKRPVRDNERAGVLIGIRPTSSS